MQIYGNFSRNPDPVLQTNVWKYENPNLDISNEAISLKFDQ